MPNFQKNQITIELAKELITLQFPQWKDLSVREVKESGWDNRTFHLGDEMAIRLPSNEQYAPQILKESHWLPILAQELSISIPTLVALGLPCTQYPWHWSINRWIEGEPASLDRINDLSQFAMQLGRFLTEFQGIDATGGPIPGQHNFYRGGSLWAYDEEMRQAIPLIQNEQNKKIAEQLWNEATSSAWTQAPVWVHGDIAVGNLLVKQGALCAVIDFGQLAIGDPACDLAIAWNLFTGESREAFRKSIPLDRDTWIRGLAWTLWKTLCWPIKGTDVKRIIRDVLEDYQTVYK